MYNLLNRPIAEMQGEYTAFVKTRDCLRKPCGETAENKMRILQGHRDTSLSDKGIRQATLLAERLKNTCFTHVYTSDLRRAKETCKIIMDSNSCSTKQVTEDIMLRERKLGSLEGKHIDEWRKIGSKQEVSLGMETKEELHNHAISFFQSLCRQMRLAYSDAKHLPSAILEPTSTVNKQSNSPAVAKTRTSSKKRKHIGSGSSLSDFEGLSPTLRPDERSAVSFFTGSRVPPTLSAEEWRLGHSSPSSSSSSGCSSTATVCDLEADNSDLPTSLMKQSNNANIISTEAPMPTTAVTSRSQTPFCSESFSIWSCPNVTLPLAPDRPITRVSSIGSGRGGSLDESVLDFPSLPFASVLVVSHGGLISELVAHFADELGCQLPGGYNAAQQITPNAALSRFSITMLPAVDDDELEDPDAWIQSRIECIALHDQDHLISDLDATPLATRDAL